MTLARKFDRFTLMGPIILLTATSLLQAHSVQVCKASDPSQPVGGTFTFEIYAAGVGSAPVVRAISPGSCTDIIQTINGEILVVERATGATELVSITAEFPDRLARFDLTARTAVVLAIEDPRQTIVTFTNRSITGNQGCTPGFYKNHPEEFTAPYTPSTQVGSVFSGVLSSLASLTLLQALDGGGGSGITGAQSILLRAATAALLNAAHPDVSYALTVTQVISQVNAALATNNRDTMLSLADRLDSANNGAGGCPL